MSTSPQNSPAVSRRTVAAGLAWTAPALAAAVAAPAFAASTTTLTATSVTPQVYWAEFYRASGTSSIGCQYSGGYIDTQGITPTGGPKAGSTPDGDGLLSPSSSIGYWLETSNSTSGVARIDSVTTTYTFSNPIVIDNCPTGGYNTTGTWTWTQCTTLNGWTYSLSTDRKTLTMTYSKPTIVNTSTASARSGTYLPGFFINYHLAGGCVGSNTTTITSKTTMTYSTKTYPTGTTFTKQTSVRYI